MASDETMNFHSSLQDEEYLDDDMDDDDHHRQWHPHPHNVSRLSVCTSSTLCGTDEDVDNALSTYVSHLSIESYEEEGDIGDDADGEFSDGKDDLPNSAAFSSDSDNELGGGCYSLPATPPRRRNRVGSAGHSPMGMKEYASENESGAKKGGFNIEEMKTKRHDPWSWRWRRRRIQRESEKKKKEEVNDGVISGESDGVRVITRAKGGRRSLCMDLEEMKACRDLGFELEKERMLEMPSHLSLSNSTLDTSSGGNSPIANWRISSPGDDPRDVKARLKVWAQAVAMASASSKYGA